MTFEQMLKAMGRKPNTTETFEIAGRTFTEYTWAN